MKAMVWGRLLSDEEIADMEERKVAAERKRHNDKRAELRDQGICTACRKVPTLDACHAVCTPCRKYHRERNREFARKAAAVAMAEGRCRYCHDAPADDGYTSCAICRDDMNRRARERRAARTGRECARCGTRFSGAMNCCPACRDAA